MSARNLNSGPQACPAVASSALETVLQMVITGPLHNDDCDSFRCSESDLEQNLIVDLSGT